MIPLAVPEIGGNEWTYIKDCLDTNWVSSVGSYVSRMEEDVAAKVGVNHCVAAVNGTAALHVAVLLSGIERDDEVIMPSLTFIATANVVRYVGAWPVFLDSERDYLLLDPNAIEAFLTEDCIFQNGRCVNKKTGRTVKAVMPVHILGHPCDMDRINDIAKRFNLKVIEDATEALGAKYKGRTVGSLADIAVFSFNGNKVITTGGGGMICIKDSETARKARYLTTQAKDDPDEYIHKEVGFNYRLTNIQAALGCAQLENLDAYVDKKQKIQKKYADAFESVPGLNMTRIADWADSICWLSTLMVDHELSGITSRELRNSLKESGIESRSIWQPLHMSDAHRDAFRGNCPVTESIYESALNIPSSVGLKESDQEFVIEQILKIQKKA